MTLLEAILEYDRARGAGRDASFPSTGGRTIVCVTCVELVEGSPTVEERFGLADEDVLVVSVPGPRVQRADGEIARAVALAAGYVGKTFGGADVIVLGHDDCVYRSPVFAIPGPSQQGESFASSRDLVRHSVAQLRASPWMARTNVQGLVVGASGRLEVTGDPVAAAGAGAIGYTPGPANLAGAGPVSLFGGAGAAGPSLGSAPPVQQGAVRWDAPPPIAPGGAWEHPVPFAPTTPMPTGRIVPQGPQVPVSLMPTVGEMPAMPTDFPAAPAMPEPTFSALESYAPAPLELDAAPPPPPPRRHQQAPPPPPRAAPKWEDRRAAPPPVPSADRDDPFARAEEILERLRREKRK